MIGLESRLCLKHEEIVAKVLDGEAVIIDLSTGVYHTTDSTGGAVWSMLHDGWRVADVADEIAERYEVLPARAREDVLRFVSELSEAGLLAVAETEQAPLVRSLGAREKTPYEPPRLRTFHDMEELLTLDPPTPSLSDIPWKE